MLSMLDQLFLWTRSKPFFYRFALFTRVLLAAGFIPTGLVKLMGERFTLISPEHPIGAFFEAMYQTGLYWRFLGATQVIAGLLLLWPRFAHLGAAIFLGVITNIFVVTVALDFRGTPIVTGLMLLAVLYLCFWDYHRFRPLLTEAPLPHRVAKHRLDRWEFAGFAVFALSLMGFFMSTRSFVGTGFNLAFVSAGIGAGLFTLGRFVWVAAKPRPSAVKPPN
jgi:hypothetical protein